MASLTNSTDNKDANKLTILGVLRDLTALFILSIPGVLIFIALFWAGFLKQSSPILMYRGITLAIAAAALQIVIISKVWQAKYYPAGAKSPIVAAATALALAFNIAFLIVVPVTVDRSVTVFLLGQIARSPNGIRAADLRQALVSTYVDQYNAVDRRMREQSLSGNVIADGDVYKLTAQGERFINFSRFVGAIFGADLRYVSTSSLDPAPDQQN